MTVPFSLRYGIPRDPDSRVLAQSEAIGWSSIFAAAYRHEGRTDAFETVATSRQKLLVMASGIGEFDVRLKGKWRRLVRTAGSASLQPGGSVRTLRWRPLSANFETAQLYVPNGFFLAAADEYRRLGWKYRTEPLDSTDLADPIVASVAGAIVAGVRAGAPDLYAQSAAQFLALHLLRVENGWPSAEDDLRRAGKLSDRRLANVIEFVRNHYMEQLSLEQLAREAGVSRHHFAHLFKTGTGTSPHRFLTDTRLEAALIKLSTTDDTVLDIALACGYYGTSHFSWAFRRRFGRTPTAFRAEARAETSDASGA